MPTTPDIPSLLPADLRPYFSHVTTLASLWAGYGHIYRIHLCASEADGSQPPPFQSCILKYIDPPVNADNNDDSEEGDEEEEEGVLRKLLSYRVEANFYEYYSERFNRPPTSSSSSAGPRYTVPTFLSRPTSTSLLLSDLALSHPTFPSSRQPLTYEQALAGLDWFARFHATWWGYTADVESGKDCPTTRQVLQSRRRKGFSTDWKGKGVWQVGTYNYLQTRLHSLYDLDVDSEWYEVFSGPLSFALDYALQKPDQRGMTLVHGDAKAANMALTRSASSRGNQSSQTEGGQERREAWDVALFDFQYVGPGLPTQDLIKYLLTALPQRHLQSVDDEMHLLEFWRQRFLVHLEELSPSTRTTNAMGTQAQSDPYPLTLLQRHLHLSHLAWLRFVMTWSGGPWGNVDWLIRRGRELLQDKGQKRWLQDVLQEWEQEGQYQPGWQEAWQEFQCRKMGRKEAP